MKYIKLFESWQWFNKKDDDKWEDREYRCTLAKLLDWEIPDWRIDPEWIEDVVMVDEEWVDPEQAEYYLERFIFMQGEEIDVDSQMIDGQVLNSWWMDGEYFTFITQDWPFTEFSETLNPEENKAFNRISSELEGDTESSEISTADVIDFVEWSVRQKRIDPRELTVTGFKNWLDLQRGWAN